MEKMQRVKVVEGQTYEAQHWQSEAEFVAAKRRMRHKDVAAAWRWYSQVGGVRVGRLVRMGVMGRSPHEVVRIGMRAARQAKDCQWIVWLRSPSGKSWQCKWPDMLVPCAAPAAVAQSGPPARAERPMDMDTGGKRKASGRACLSSALGDLA